MNTWKKEYYSSVVTMIKPNGEQNFAIIFNEPKIGRVMTMASLLNRGRTHWEIVEVSGDNKTIWVEPVE